MQKSKYDLSSLGIYHTAQDAPVTSGKKVRKPTRYLESSLTMKRTGDETVQEPGVQIPNQKKRAKLKYIQSSL